MEPKRNPQRAQKYVPFKEVVLVDVLVNGIRRGIIHAELHAGAGEPNRVERVRDPNPMKSQTDTECPEMGLLRSN